MKALKYVFISVAFFILHSVFSITLMEFRIIKIFLYVLLIIFFSVINFKYLYDSKKIVKDGLFILLVNFFVFEVKKITEYSLGYLPYYTEVPFYFSLILSFFLFLFYAITLIVVVNFTKIKNR